MINASAAVQMSGLAHKAQCNSVSVRVAAVGDLDALMALEHRVFSTDRLSRRSLRHFLQSPTAVVLVAQDSGSLPQGTHPRGASQGTLAGTAIVLFRPRSAAARLYSIAVAPHMSGRGVAPMLLAAAEDAARMRGCTSIRLEVHVTNHPAISRYRKSGYQEFGRRRAYYEDGGDALRFQKPIAPG